MKRASINRGFTLIEVLAALVVLSALTGVGYAGLRAVLDSERVLSREHFELKQLQLALTMLQDDLRQLLSEPGRLATNDVPLPALQVNAVGELQLLRTGWPGSDSPQAASPQRVTYRIERSALWREHRLWLATGQADRVRRKILGNVESMQIRILDGRGMWHSDWPLEDASPASREVRAVQIALVMGKWGEINRLMRVPARW